AVSLRLLGRPPREDELAAGIEFLTAAAARTGSDEPDAAATALADYCLAIFNTNEFVYVD
ncbi:MAG: hypothetical protein KY476_12640, partial [Planctomycetes bacterium]|nr:hypothetical protein [Planctomycetota bacterium]